MAYYNIQYIVYNIWQLIKIFTTISWRMMSSENQKLNDSNKEKRI
jgi:hypothetical protein